ncbi:NAD(P)H-binding protein [Liquorilactobacillus cacaonum]|uniref:NADH dehydrogenase n=1 Tax=Liquorilactobacillus cacaonum DSM 21116 TaxID=1423729 RepID=A0A0R2CF25_9LACO|nr:NAD(P)H-binding protein [Liquorilactobacillus cacaonum]KRM89925.1 NADH dehydrogenase [Liquorilactobacillus cacaonum DSM 21116]
MKIVLLGGSGYVGKGIIQTLNTHPDIHLVSMSRHGGTAAQKEEWPNVNWVSVDLYNSETWRKEIIDADWIVDLIGVLFAKNYNEYYQKTVAPVMNIIKFIEKEKLAAKFLFVSANYAPIGMKNYLKAKLVLERELKERLGIKTVIVYPGLIYHKERPSVYIIGKSLKILTRLKIFNRFITPLRPISRGKFASEIENVIVGKDSYLTKRNIGS